MRLNKHHKQAFVIAVVQDIPTVDYDEQAQKLVRDALFQKMPLEIQVIYENKKLREWLVTNHIRMPGSLSSLWTQHVGSHNPPAEINDQLEELARLKQEQTAKVRVIAQKVGGLINSVSTRKQALELMPEFEKYLPKETGSTGVTNLPAIQNTVAELVHMGWPKGEEKVA